MQKYQNKYWAVAGNTSQVYSSNANAYVAITDAPYVSWLAAGNLPTPISPNDMIDLQIIDLEFQQTSRRMRESISDQTWMNALNAQISALRASKTS